MTRREFDTRLQRRAKRAAVTIDEPLADRLHAYFTLLARWNVKINLTALPLNPPSDETFDRLFVEALAAARHLADGTRRWLDVGTGGGSPAVPLKLAKPAVLLTMVESKSRKAAFLREVIRVLPLVGAEVWNGRFEHLAEDDSVAQAGVITARAVRPDAKFAKTAISLLEPQGCLILFHSESRGPVLRGFTASPAVRLIEGVNSFLTLYRRVFHVEQSD